MNKRRLLKLADLLEADAENKKGIRFDLTYVGKKFDPDDGVVGFDKGDVVKVSCGTVACAVGLAAISGAFKRAGLSYALDLSIGELTPVFGDHYGWHNAETAFFDITRHESAFLFHADSYPGNKTHGKAGERIVAKRIRDFVAGRASPDAA